MTVYLPQETEMTTQHNVMSGVTCA